MLILAVWILHLAILPYQDLDYIFDLLCGPTAKDKCTCHCILQLLGHFRDLKQSFKGEIRYVRISQLSNSYSKPIEGSMSPEYCR